MIIRLGKGARLWSGGFIAIVGPGIGLFILPSSEFLVYLRRYFPCPIHPALPPPLLPPFPLPSPPCFPPRAWNDGCISHKPWASDLDFYLTFSFLRLLRLHRDVVSTSLWGQGVVAKWTDPTNHSHQRKMLEILVPHVG